MNLPNWLNTKEEYTPSKDSSFFIDKTLLSIGSTLFRFQKKHNSNIKYNASVILLFIFITILTLSLSLNYLYIGTILACLIFKLISLKNDALISIMHVTKRACIVSCIILLPCLFTHHISTFIMINLKVFISATLISLFNTSYSTSEITSAFRKFKISSLFIYIIDIALKYIVLFSKICEEMLWSLKCRTVGMIHKKNEVVTNIIGNVFVKGQYESKEMLDAMKCRGFTGEYSTLGKHHLCMYDYFILLCIVLELFLFIIL